MANLQIERTNFIEARAVNPYGSGPADILDNYETQSTIEVSEDKEYKSLQKAEASYFLAGARLNSCGAIKQFNDIARQKGYNQVNLLHRHDVDY